jgi:hypothetical protein
LAEELREVGVVAHDKDVLVCRALAHQAVKLRIDRRGRECGRDENLLLVAGLGPDQLRGLRGALERAGDDQVKADLHGVEDVCQLQALGLAVLVEWTLEVE